MVLFGFLTVWCIADRLLLGLDFKHEILQIRLEKVPSEAFLAVPCVL